MEKWMVKGIAIILLGLATVVSYNKLLALQAAKSQRQDDIYAAEDRYMSLKSKAQYYDTKDERLYRDLKAQMESIKREYNLFDGYKDKVINRYEGYMESWLFILVFSFGGLCILFPPLKWLVYMVLGVAAVGAISKKQGEDR